LGINNWGIKFKLPHIAFLEDHQRHAMREIICSLIKGKEAGATPKPETKAESKPDTVS
jgi:hypothetical protein